MWQVEGNALSLWGAVAGLRCSSLRTELSAGCIAATAKGPVHQATDSMAYMRKINRLLAGEDLTRRKPWALQQDGDLWQIMDDIIKAKGPQSLRVTWTKGHATEEHIQQGKSTPLRKLGNDKADQAADKGVGQHTDGLLDLTHYYIAKQRVAIALLARIRAMFPPSAQGGGGPTRSHRQNG